MCWPSAAESLISPPPNISPGQGTRPSRKGTPSMPPLPESRNCGKRSGITWRSTPIISYKPDQILVSNGAEQVLIEAMMALLDPGDEVIIPVPCWVSYPEQVKLADGVPVLIERQMEDDFRLRPEQVAKKITPRTKMMILCNPDNPTGGVMKEEDLRGIAELAVRHRFYVISDEIYSRLIYDGHKHLAFGSFSEEV